MTEKRPSCQNGKTGALVSDNFEGAATMAYDINKAKMILKILKEEYGITSEKELDEAIKRQGFINVTPFCATPRSVSRPPSHSEQ